MKFIFKLFLIFILILSVTSCSNNSSIKKIAPDINQSDVNNSLASATQTFIMQISSSPNMTTHPTLITPTLKPSSTIKKKVTSTIKPSISTSSTNTIPASKKTAYITLDDGPSRNNTPKNLDTLRRYGIKATFFVLPRDNVDDVYRRIIDEGHLLGNHSYCHDMDYLYNTTIDNFKDDVLKARDLISNKFGYTTKVFRFPGGTSSKDTAMINERIKVISELGYKYYSWTMSTGDTDANLKSYGDENQIVQILANNIITKANDKSKIVILMHDDETKTYSALALPLIIEGLKQQGYKFDTLSNY